MRADLQEFVITPSGELESRFFTITYAPARDESGQILGVTVIAIETTQRVQMERERHQARMEQSRLTAQLVGNVQRLQQLDRRHAFLRTLADGLRTLNAPDAAIDLASALLGRDLDVSRVIYAEVDDSAGTFSIRRDWTANGQLSTSGETRNLNDFGPEVIASLRVG